ncbi:MAG: GIY-YIG nuclease family protein [Trueperaceae bacterium]|nr:GIY-YIG nuclease family protein [Trueperaceae bacterium]
MPIFSRWRRLEALPPQRGRDAMPGIYELANLEKQTIYIGQSAKDVPNRIRQHLQKSACVKEQIAFWRYEASRVPQAEEARHIALYIERYKVLPLCNEATPKERDSLKRYLERSRG